MTRTSFQSAAEYVIVVDFIVLSCIICSCEIVKLIKKMFVTICM